MNAAFRTAVRRVRHFGVRPLLGCGRAPRGRVGFLYSVMRQCLTELGCEDPGEELFKIFVENFGRGVEIGPPPQYDGRYDGKTPLDLETLACLYFLEGFAAAAATGKEAPPQSPLLPGVARQMASDLLMFLVCYSSRVPQGRLVRGFLSLITIWLFVYTVKLFHAANFLARRGQLAPAMTDRWRDSPPEIYVDFTGLRESVSDRLARQCVERDLAEMRAYLETALRVRTLERFVTQLPEKEDELAGLSGSERVMKLLEFSADPGVRADARAEIRAIKEETLKALEQEAAKRAAEEFFGDIRRRFDPDSLGELIYLLLQSQGQKGVGNSGRWFWSCAGLNKPYGILSGNLRGRRNWRYAMGNELLAALVYLAAVAQQGPWQLGERREPKPLRILDFLQFLRSRFGILVDRPPEFADSAEARAAATENLMALKRRLRQMGFFEELSDDFTAQHIHVVVETEHEHKSRAHHARML